MAKLVVTAGPLIGKEYDLPAPRLSVGRDDSSMVQIVDGSVSRSHALLERDAEGHKIRDLASTNGVWVNGVRVMEARLKHGDQVRMGHVEMKYVGEPPAAVRAPTSEVTPPTVSAAPLPRTEIRLRPGPSPAAPTLVSPEPAVTLRPLESPPVLAPPPPAAVETAPPAAPTAASPAVPPLLPPPRPATSAVAPVLAPAAEPSSPPPPMPPPQPEPEPAAVSPEAAAPPAPESIAPQPTPPARDLEIKKEGPVPQGDIKLRLGGPPAGSSPELALKKQEPAPKSEIKLRFGPKRPPDEGKK